MTKDKLFYRFAIGLFILMLLYGAGMTFAFIYVSENVATRMIGAFSSMFSGALGLGAGYLLGARTNGNGHT